MRCFEVRERKAEERGGRLRAHVDIGVENLGGDVGVGSVPLVDSKDPDDELSGGEERREGSGGEVGREEGFPLRLVRLLLDLELWSREGGKEEGATSQRPFFRRKDGKEGRETDLEGLNLLRDVEIGSSVGVEHCQKGR